jgi:hypothetical protein
MKNSAFEDFSEGVMAACYDAYDFKTCQRKNGSVYGIPDKSSCQTGKEVKSSVGNNPITDLRMATGRDARKLDVDVMSSLGPDALVKIYADNFVDGGGRKQEILAEKAKARILGIREGEIDINSSDMGMFSGIGKAFGENLANSIFIGETTQAQDPTRAGVIDYSIRYELKKRIEETGMAYELSNLKPGLDGVRQLLSDEGDRAIVTDQLAQLGIGNMDGLRDDIFSAAKVAALVGGMTKEEGMTSQEMIVHGAEVLADALRAATKEADNPSALPEPSAEDIKRGVDTIKDAVSGKSGGGRDSQGNAGRIKDLIAELKDPNSNMSPDTRATTRALITALGGTPPPKAPAAPKAPPAPANAKPPGMGRFSGTATFVPKGKPAEALGLKLNNYQVPHSLGPGYYVGRWSDGYKADYQFGNNGEVRIISHLSSGKDITAGKWDSYDGTTTITSKTGNKTYLPEFYPQRTTGPLLKPTK